MYESTNIHKVFSTKLQGNVHLLLVDVKEPRCCVVLGYACAWSCIVSVFSYIIHTIFLSREKIKFLFARVDIPYHTVLEGDAYVGAKIRPPKC